ncbi:hypothetical protein ACIPYS_19460 [Kitasatospora sp. NPDC089913]|uniref:hypothetical protein n=1 Tax=Streptomycetaceae TaxID=2062 RepID=UPI000879AD23|nr:hypothetical protein [Streptomyces sp. TLI_053]SDT74056.1 hypothetical protein SAMN05216371_4629 [Streptomyces sp. TLI_053]
MSYELQALIGPAELVAVAAAEVPAARPRPLAQGLALIPATPEFLAAFRGGEGTPPAPGAPSAQGAPSAPAAPRASGPVPFDWFPDGLERRLAAWSKAAPIACVEADYFGGTGTQRAAVWADGRLDVGPVTSGEFEPFPPEGSPISQALRRLGARVGEGDDARDEFDAVGLGAHRATASWVSGG